MNAPAKQFQLKPLKAKKCKVCPNTFTPQRPLQMVCGTPCAIVYGNKLKARKEADTAKKERQALRERKEAIKGRKEWEKDAARWFNKWVRLRDAHLPCISCGRTELTYLESWDCGHFRTVGSAKHMQFIEDNAHKQCSTDNRGSEKYIQKRERISKAYEESLRLRIGNERVDAVKNDNTPRHYTIEDFKAIKAKYKTLCKELENATIS
jgi:hypothetical protein